jgi:hypothetical protein
MRTLHRLDALRHHNILRLTLPHTAILAALTGLDNNFSATNTKFKYSTSSSGRTILANWDVTRKARTDTKCLAALAILPNATSGQVGVVGNLLGYAMLGRDGTMTDLQIEDVRGVIEEVYVMAGAVGSVWPGKNKGKGKGKERAVDDEEEEEEEMGEDGGEDVVNDKMVESDDEDEVVTSRRTRRI